jgi:hypothetical protein
VFRGWATHTTVGGTGGHAGRCIRIDSANQRVNDKRKKEKKDPSNPTASGLGKTPLTTVCPSIPGLECRCADACITEGVEWASRQPKTETGRRG